MSARRTIDRRFAGSCIRHFLILFSLAGCRMEHPATEVPEPPTRAQLLEEMEAIDKRLFPVVDYSARPIDDPDLIARRDEALRRLSKRRDAIRRSLAVMEIEELEQCSSRPSPPTR